MSRERISDIQREHQEGGGRERRRRQRGDADNGQRDAGRRKRRRRRKREEGRRYIRIGRAERAKRLKSEVIFNENFSVWVRRTKVSGRR